MILASMVVSGKPRMLLLRPSGEVWPISTNDVQFMMPKSLINPSLADKCWSSDLLELWASGEEATGAEISEAMSPMQTNRRKAVMVLRRIGRETEKMCGKMMGDIGRSHFGGIEGVWDKVASEDENQPVSVTSAQVAELILNAGRDPLEGEIEVRPHTLPAYAAHTLMMMRSDLFLAAPSNMGTSGRFIVRSRLQRAQLQTVGRFLNPKSNEDHSALATFLDKARQSVAISRKLKEELTGEVEEFKAAKVDVPEWTEEEKAVVSTMLTRLHETRNTQVFEATAFVTTIMRLMGTYDKAETLDERQLPTVLKDMGILPPWEGLRQSAVLETEARELAVAEFKHKKELDLLQGNELDELRHDFTDHKVFVIDDASASELDDGIALERIPGTDSVWIHVHVADPTRFISSNSSIAERASFRGSSTYLPEGDIPLFPIEVIMKELSLGAKTERDGGAQGTMVFSSKMSAEGEILDHKVRMGWIKNPRLVTYSAVNEVIGAAVSTVTRPLGTPKIRTSGPSKDYDFTPEDREDLKAIQRYATAHKKRRLRDAGFEWADPSEMHARVLTKIPWKSAPQNYFDPAQTPSKPAFYPGEMIYDYSVSHSASTYTGLPSGGMVAEMMIAAGRTAAMFCEERNIPVPYRCSAQPTIAVLPGQPTTTLDKLLAMRDPESLAIDKYTLVAANMVYQPGDVSFTPGVHWAMGLTSGSGYLRATSPLRRYDDMLVHWQIKSALAKEKQLSNASQLAPEISEERLKELVSRSEPQQKVNNKTSKKAAMWWCAGLIEQRLRNPFSEAYTYGDDAINIGQVLTARIAGPTVYGTVSAANTTPVMIPALGLETRLPGMGKSDYVIGEEVKVRVIRSQQWPAAIVDVEPVRDVPAIV